MEAGDAFFSEGRFAEAERYYLKARHIFTAAHGEDHFKVGIVCLKLSRVYGGMCMEKERGEENAKADNILSRKFQQRLTNDGIDELGSEFDGFDVFVSSLVFGSDYLPPMAVSLDDKYFQDMKLIAKLDKRRALDLGEDVSDVRCKVHNILGFQYKTRGKLGKALKMFQKALRMRRSAGKADDERVADELGNISGIFLEQERLVEARANYEEALGILRRLHGEMHPKVASTFEGIADILRRQGKCDEALEVCKKVLNIQRRVYGKDHIEVAGTFYKIGTILFDLGKFDESAQVHEEAVRIQNLGNLGSAM
jgi:tetratricopeptide (TPR) repeat protein